MVPSDCQAEHMIANDDIKDRSMQVDQGGYKALRDEASVHYQPSSAAKHYLSSSSTSGTVRPSLQKTRSTISMSNTVVISWACAIVLFAATVTSSPVLPETDLKMMAPDHACLFMCEMCFSGHVQEILYCVNKICTPGVCNAPGLVWLSRTCKNQSLLDKYLLD